MEREKILLITDVPPCKNLSGGAMTLQLTKFLLDEKHEVNIFLVNAKEVQNEIDEEIKSAIKVTQCYKPNENWNGDINKTYNSEIKKITKKLSQVISDGNFTKIWGIIQGQTLLEILNFCKQNYKIPYVCQIWDTIDWWMKANNYSSKRSKYVKELYYDVIKGSSYCITASWKMNEALNKECPHKYIELMPYVKKEELEPSVKKKKNTINISMIGQVYAKNELDSLLTALDKMKWKINGKKVFFHHYGNFSEQYIDTVKHSEYFHRIKIHGFIEQTSLLYILKSSDLLYCPYFISNDKEYQEVSKTSFPSKYITYLAVGVPILLHGPNYASPYIFSEENKCAYLLDNLNIDDIVQLLKKIEKEIPNKEIIENAKKAYENNFTPEIIKNKFFKALNIEKNNGFKILEVNNIDLSGKRFNGYDLLHYINENTNHICNQIVTYKQSEDYHVKKFYENYNELLNEYKLLEGELNILSVHNVISLTTNILRNNDFFKEADIVHYHLVDNTKLSLCQLAELCSLKPSVITLHDPWWFTGRCVYPQECTKWENGCHNCEYIENVFSLPRDNCNALWNLKKKIYKDIDADIIVATPFMDNFIKESPLTKDNFKNVHLVPFGLDLDSFKSKITQEEAKEYFGIDKNDIVIFLRSQLAYKGTEYVLEAMKMLETDKKITLLTCSEVGLLDEVKNKFNVIDLGEIKDDKMHLAYTACDMFLMPSRGETFGLMAIEAMASSKPIIVFDNTALPYVTFAPECGVLVENKNSKKLMMAIKMLLDNEEERLRRGKLGRELCEKHYDITKYHDEILKVYQHAYERQKNKKILSAQSNKKINYNDPMVKETIIKLRKIYQKLGFSTSLDEKIFKKFPIIEEKNIQIDYTNEDVYNLIIEFNNYVYKIFNMEILHAPDKELTAHDFKFIHKLMRKYYGKLKKYPILFRPTRFIYRSARDITKKIRYGKKHN